MTEIEILCKYDEAVTSFAAGLAAGLLDKDMEDEFKEQYELFKAGRDALREKQEREKGCEFCRKELDDYPYINACGDCDSSGTVYTPAFCPMCGRPLSET